MLVSMARVLGPSYLPAVMDALRAALPDRGFMAHVTGFTLHAVVEGLLPVSGLQALLLKPVHALHPQPPAIAPRQTELARNTPLLSLQTLNALPPCHAKPLQDAEPGALDGCVAGVLAVIEDDLFGDTAEAKEASAFIGPYR